MTVNHPSGSHFVSKFKGSGSVGPSTSVAVAHSLGGDWKDYIIEGIVTSESTAHDPRTVPYVMPGVGATVTPSIGAVNAATVTVYNFVVATFGYHVHIVRFA